MKILAFSPALLAALLAPAWAQVPPPAEQRRFVEIVVQAQQEFKRADNAMQKGGAKQRRESALCKLLPEREVTGWTGKVTTIDANSDGKGVLGIEIAPNVLVKTWNNAFSDMMDKTLIDPSSEVFQAASALKKGQVVSFSGRFLPGTEGDCLREGSMTLGGKVTSPEFIFQFDGVGAPGARLGGAAPGRMSNALEAATSPFGGRKSAWAPFQESGGLDKQNRWFGIELRSVELRYDREGNVVEFAGSTSRTGTTVARIRQVINGLCGLTEEQWKREVRDDYVSGEAENERCKAVYLPENRSNWTFALTRKVSLAAAAAPAPAAAAAPRPAVAPALAPVPALAAPTPPPAAGARGADRSPSAGPIAGRRPRRRPQLRLRQGHACHGEDGLRRPRARRPRRRAQPGLPPSARQGRRQGPSAPGAAALAARIHATVRRHRLPCPGLPAAPGRTALTCPGACRPAGPRLSREAARLRA
jgi:hypothetical protein